MAPYRLTILDCGQRQQKIGSPGSEPRTDRFNIRSEILKTKKAQNHTGALHHAPACTRGDAFRGACGDPQAGVHSRCRGAVRHASLPPGPCHRRASLFSARLSIGLIENYIQLSTQMRDDNEILQSGEKESYLALYAEGRPHSQVRSWSTELASTSRAGKEQSDSMDRLPQQTNVKCKLPPEVLT